MAEAAAYAIPVSTRAAPADAGHRTRRQSDTLVAWLLTAPAAAAYILMLLVPTLAMLVLSFTDYEFSASTFRWVGMANFTELMADRGAVAAVRNTALYVLFVTPISVVIGLLLAVMIEAGLRGRMMFRAIFFLPVVSLTAAMAVAWQYILHPNIGPLNAFLRMFVASPPNWLGTSETVLFSLGLIGIWENIGFNMVLFLAGLMAIPRELYSAAEIDGAPGAWSRFTLVTWPLLGPTTLFIVTITTIRSIRVFDTVAVLTQGGPNKASEVLLHTMYMEGFQFFRMGYSAAITMLFLAVVLVLMLLQTRLIERRVHYT